MSFCIPESIMVYNHATAFRVFAAFRCRGRQIASASYWFRIKLKFRINIYWLRVEFMPFWFPERAVWHSKTGRFRIQNGPFCIGICKCLFFQWLTECLTRALICRRYSPFAAWDRLRENIKMCNQWMKNIMGEACFA